MSETINWEDQNTVPRDLILTRTLIYDCCQFVCSQLYAESESKEYDGYRFLLNNKKICYRKAKITPTKTGQFVTLWKRNEKGITTPFDYSDNIDFVIISVRKDDLFGQFIFPKAVLIDKSIFSSSSSKGKRAIRIYPPWNITESKQARNTQNWQLDYFLEFPVINSIDLNLAKKLLS